MRSGSPVCDDGRRLKHLGGMAVFSSLLKNHSHSCYSYYIYMYNTYVGKRIIYILLLQKPNPPVLAHLGLDAVLGLQLLKKL